MSAPWPTPSEIRDRNFARLTAEEKLRWLQAMKAFVQENLGKARETPPTAPAAPPAGPRST